MFNGPTAFYQDISGWVINETVTKDMTYKVVIYIGWYYLHFATGSPLLQNKEFLPEKLQQFFK